jgi:hypothetical protein
VSAAIRSRLVAASPPGPTPWFTGRGLAAAGLLTMICTGGVTHFGTA